MDSVCCRVLTYRDVAQSLPTRLHVYLDHDTFISQIFGHPCFLAGGKSDDGFICPYNYHSKKALAEY